jgi:RNA ligase (TIGR02306 family)
MYKIASIEKVLAVRDHPNADRLSLVSILGWQVVARRGDFAAGDLVVYIEPDSVLEERPQYEFLRERNFRVKLIKLRGEISQGLLFPLSAFTWQQPMDERWLGKSVADQIGARHYEKPAPGAVLGEIAGPFPSFLVKTDEMNLRSYPAALQELRGQECYMTLKLDGTSVSFYQQQGEIGACSRNYSLTLTETSALGKVAQRYQLPQKLAAIGKPVAIQAELYGPGVQANRMAIRELELAIFNLYWIEERRFANYAELQAFAEAQELPLAPLLWQGKCDFSLEQLLQKANQLRYPNNAPAEGLVLRPMQECYSPTLQGRLSVKVMSEAFLEEYGE